MPTPERCRAHAAEAERLARLVSYERDRVRLLRQAEEWRARADALEAAGPPAATVEETAPREGRFGRLMGLLRR